MRSCRNEFEIQQALTWAIGAFLLLFSESTDSETLSVIQKVYEKKLLPTFQTTSIIVHLLRLCEHFSISQIRTIFLSTILNYCLILFIVSVRSKSKWKINCFISKCLRKNFLPHRVVALWANCPQYPIRIIKVKTYDSHLRNDNGILYECDQQSFSCLAVWQGVNLLSCFSSYCG